MNEITDDLQKIIDKLESWDDPTMFELDRDRIGKSHYFIEGCIEKIENI